MPVSFRCPHCTTAIQVPETFAGKPVRCPKCQQVVTAPAAPVTAVTPAAPPVAPPVAATPSPKPAAVPPPIPDMPVLEEVVGIQPVPTLAVVPPQPAGERTRPGPRQKRSEGAVAAGASLGLIFGLVGGGVALLGLLVVGVFVAFMFLFSTSTSDNVAPAPAVAQAPQAQVPKKADDEGGPFQGKDPWDDQRFREKEEELKKFIDKDKKPAPQEPPVRVKLDKGVFETQVDVQKDMLPPNQFRHVKRYEFDARADTVCWVQSKGAFHVNVKVDGPAGPVALPEDKFGGGNRPELAFLAKQAGVYTAVVECDAFDAKPFTLAIREMDGTEPLPTHLKLDGPPVVLPAIAEIKALNVYDKQFSAAAFGPDGKSFWMAHGDGTLSYWVIPGHTQKGSYKTDQKLYALGVDKQGRLYGQAVAKGNDPFAPRTVGDIKVWEGLKPEGAAGALPAPSKTLPLAGIVHRLIPSPDGRWLYYLDVHNRKLGRIDTNTAAIDKEIDTLSAGARACSLTADGKTLYCCSEANKIDVIDTGTFQLTRTVVLDKGAPYDIAAANDGRVFLVGKAMQAEQFPGNGNVGLADLSKGAADARVLPLPVGHHCQFVVLLPDQTALFSGDRQVTACAVPARPALFKAATHGKFVRDYFLPGQVILSPDGRTLLHETGVILSVSR